MHASIQSLLAYEQAVSNGTLNGLAFLREVNVLQELRPGDIQHVHFLLFEKVHPWAGQYRTRGQLATIAGFPAAEPERIVREISMTLFQTSELMGAAAASGDGFQWLAAVAFFHARFERVHPFLDGNGRTGRSILAIQLEVLFGRLPGFEKQPAYRAALRASAKSDLAPLMNYLGTTAGLPGVMGPWPSAFRLQPRFMEDIAERTSLIDDLAWSRLGKG
jgi:fido (protein-threonine AMPylation protein)